MNNTNPKKQTPVDKPAREPEPNAVGSIASFFVNTIFMAWILFAMASLFLSSQTKVLPYSQFLDALKTDKVHELVITDKQINGTYDEGKAAKPFMTYRVDPQLSDRLAPHNIKFSATPSDNWGGAIFSILMPILVLFMIGSWMSRGLKGGDGLAAPFLSIERSRARIVPEDKIGITFADVAGIDEAIDELKEVVGFLKEPSKYNGLGGRLPKGLLLVGPPGTGKTLIARAVAGEAGVPFFSISGSEFVELFVGVGAARVRDLFAQARQKAPCIIFIDELDALGRSRGASPLVGGHDEKEQTLNQLLVELDGFDSSTGVILLAATNRPEILDPALLRAGRFDRQLVIDRPDKLGRESILRVHLRKVRLGQDVDVAKLAAATPGFTGADLANVVNEAALLGTRRKASAVEERDFHEAIERTIAGLEKRNRILSASERRVVAFHEMGHALVAILLPGTEHVEKVSIIPRGVAALGYTMQLPEERFILSSQELKNKLAALLGGRAAEVLVFGDASTGSADDTAKATALARAMVTRYGMDKHLGLVAYEHDENPFLRAVPGYEPSHAMSSETARQIEDAIRTLLDEAFNRATSILGQNREWLTACAEQLLHDEVLNAGMIMSLRSSKSGGAPAMALTDGRSEIGDYNPARSESADRVLN